MNDDFTGYGNQRKIDIDLRTRDSIYRLVVALHEHRIKVNSITLPQEDMEAFMGTKISEENLQKPMAIATVVGMVKVNVYQSEKIAQLRNVLEQIDNWVGTKKHIGDFPFRIVRNALEDLK